jgi:hypothetical protein
MHFRELGKWEREMMGWNYFSNFRGRFEDEDIVTGEQDGNGSAEAAEACSDHDYLVK